MSSQFQPCFKDQMLAILVSEIPDYKSDGQSSNDTILQYAEMYFNELMSCIDPELQSEDSIIEWEKNTNAFHRICSEFNQLKHLKSLEEFNAFCRKKLMKPFL